MKDHLVRLLLTYALLLAVWAVSMLGATSGSTGLLFSLSCSLSLISTFFVPPTAILVALFLLTQRVPRRALIALVYLPATAFFAASIMVPSGGYEPLATAIGIVPHSIEGSRPALLNVAVTALYIPATFVIFFISWLKPKSRRAKKQSELFLLAAIIGMASTVVMTILKMPLQYLFSIYAYALIMYIAMRRYRLALDAPSFARDRLWDHVREELVLTDTGGGIVSWNAKAAERFSLADGETRNVASLFVDDGSLRDFVSEGARDEKATIDRKYLRVADEAGDLVALTARCVRDSYGDGLGFVFLTVGCVPFRFFKDKYGITAKEWEVLGLLAAGKEYKDIGDLLFVSPFTVKNHAHSAYQKIGIKSRHELIPTFFP